MFILNNQKGYAIPVEKNFPEVYRNAIYSPAVSYRLWELTCKRLQLWVAGQLTRSPYSCRASRLVDHLLIAAEGEEL